MDGRVTGFVAMRWFVLLAMLVLAQLTEGPADAATSCAREDFALTVDRAGAALRQLNADNAPRLRAKMRELKEARGWPDAGFEEKAYEILQDERMAAAAAWPVSRRPSAACRLHRSLHRPLMHVRHWR